MILSREWIDVLGYVSLALSLASFLFKDAERTKRTIAGSQFFLALHYGLLSAWTSATLQAVLMLRSFASSFTKSMTAKHIVFTITMIALIVFTAITWTGPISLLPLVGSGIASVALCYCNNKWMRGLLILGAICWFFNAYIWASVPLMIAEAVKTVFNLYTLIAIHREEQAAGKDVELREATTAQ